MTFGDKIRKLRIEKKMAQQKLGAMVAFLIEQFELGKLMDDIQSRAVYIKNWQMHFSVGVLILWMIMKPCAWVMMSQVNILVLNRQDRFLNRQLLYLPVELWPMRTKLFSWMRWRDFIWNQKRTEENGKKKWTVLFSCLLEKKNRTYNSVNDPEIFTLEIELLVPVVRV